MSLDRLSGRRLCLAICVALFALSTGTPLSRGCEEARPVVTFAFAGDVMLGRGVASSVDAEWREALEGVRPWLEGADMGFVNLESPVTERPQLVPGHDLRAPVASVIALKDAGIDIVSLANNHALDAGVLGRGDTVRALGTAGIAVAMEPVACHLASDAAEPGSRGRYRIVALDDSRAPLDVNRAAWAVQDAATCDCPIIVSIHWGGEFQAEPSRRQRWVARALADAGASVIVGHGPHVLQPVTWLGDTLVAYSLGNLLFDQAYPRDCRWGAILRVTFEGRRAIRSWVVPTVTHHGRTRIAVGQEDRAIRARLELPQRGYMSALYE